MFAASIFSLNTVDTCTKTGGREEIDSPVKESCGTRVKTRIEGSAMNSLSSECRNNPSYWLENEQSKSPNQMIVEHRWPFACF